MKKLFFIEITDTFGGEANYSWVTRHIIKAKSERGAINALSHRSGLNWHNVGGDRYDSRSGSTCCFVEEYYAEHHDHYTYSTDDRS